MDTNIEDGMKTGRYIGNTTASEFRLWNLQSRVQVLEFRASGFGVWGLGFGVLGAGYGILGV